MHRIFPGTKINTNTAKQNVNKHEMNDTIDIENIK